MPPPPPGVSSPTSPEGQCRRVARAAVSALSFRLISFCWPLRIACVAAVSLLALRQSSFCSEPVLLSESEAQAKFDAAVQQADRVVVEYSLHTGGPTDWTQTTIGEISDPQEIRDLSKYVRLRIPEPEKRMIDGQEAQVVQQKLLDYLRAFVLTLKKGDSDLLVLRIMGDKFVGSEALRSDSVIEVDQKALAPLTLRLSELLAGERAKRSTSPQPTSDTANP